MVVVARRIPDKDIAAIRERARIEEVVGEYVALKPGGVDSLKGLSPFKDEKTPSFHVRPQHGYYHCFSTGEGGDVYSFLMKMEHITFVEAVEQLADRIGYQINYEGSDSGSSGPDRGARARIIAANAAAQKFYAEQLGSEEAQVARDFLARKGFDRSAAEAFGCGYAPSGWDTMTQALRRQGFSHEDLEAAKLSRKSSRGTYIDWFHRRILWPIRNSAGEVVGFGARKLFDDDQMGKYMNTSDSLVYKKSQVLFGIDLARKEIAKQRQAVIVEGYTDVMAMHAAGIKTAVATCGTAFGPEHMTLLRRLLLDDSHFRGQIIYTFDGDEAGKKAAMRAFAGDQQFAGKSFVAIAPGGMDPNDLRQNSGDAALRDLIASRVPMFEFAIRTMLENHDLDTAEGRVDALRETVPVVGRIQDAALRDDYARQLAGWVGWDDPGQVLRRVREESRKPKSAQGARPQRRMRAVSDDGGGSVPEENPAPRMLLPDRRDPSLWPQREALKAAVQEPALAGPLFDSLPAETFRHPAYRALAEAMANAGGTAQGKAGVEWIDAIVSAMSPSAAAQGLRSLVGELATEEIPASQDRLPMFVEGVIARVQETWVSQQIAVLRGAVQRMNPQTEADEYAAAFGDLIALESYRRGLLERASGATQDMA